ncbi:hypothetical protein EV1_010910 [Malus domestica]
MYLTEISNFPSLLPFRGAKKHSVPSNLDLISSSFDDAVLRHLKSLGPPSISLSWLSKAVDFLALTHSEARNLISDLKVAPPLDDSLAWYLDHSVKLLDLCNSISAEIERLRQRRLHLTFVLHLLGDRKGEELPSPENLRRSRMSLSDFDRGASSGFGKRSKAEALVRDLNLGLTRLSNAPRGKISSVAKLVRRTVRAVGLVTVFIAGIAVSTIHGSPDMVRVRASAEFPWAESFNELESAVWAELKRRFGRGNDEKLEGMLEELDDVGTRVKEACGVVDDLAGVAEVNKEEKERFYEVVKVLGKATASFSDGLDRLSSGVNEMFDGVLRNRNHMTENVRVSGVGKKP